MFLTVKDLKKSYGSTSNKVEVLKGINFEVEKGEICVLLGPSGSGKSTLLNALSMTIENQGMGELLSGQGALSSC